MGQHICPPRGVTKVERSGTQPLCVSRHERNAEQALARTGLWKVHNQSCLYLGEMEKKSFVEPSLERGLYEKADSMRKNPSALINIQRGPSYMPASRTRQARGDLV